MAKEIRITFKESENELYEYIKSKSSPSAFLKDLSTVEKKREEIYLNGKSYYNSEKSILDEKSKETNITTKDINDLSIDDLE